MKKWVKFAIAGAIAVGVTAYLLTTGLSQHGIYYAEVSELLENPVKFNTKGARISGEVAQGSVLKDVMDKKLLRFSIKDQKNASMAVEYKGVVPDAFEEGVTVILEGNYDTLKKVFYAKTLMAKCPSKYEGKDPAEHNTAVSVR